MHSRLGKHFRTARAIAAAAVPLALAAAVVATPAQAAAMAEMTPEAIDAYVAEVVETSGVPGLSVVVTQGDEVVFAEGYGHGSTGAPITPDSPMRVASVSKSFTAMAVMILVEEGKVELDAPVVEQLPELAMSDPRVGDVTVRQLLDQTSGFSDTTVDMVELGTATSLTDYVSKVSDSSLASDPGTRWAYCNANLNVAARLVEVAGGQGFDAFMRDRVFGPLGMTNSATHDQDADPGLGYNSLYGWWIPRAEPADFIDNSGSGGIITSAADMGRWLISQNGHGTQLVSAEGLGEMHTASAVEDYGMGWSVESDGRLTHSGNLMTFNAVESIDPGSGYGIAVLTNGAGMADVTYSTMEGLVAMGEGAEPEKPGSDVVAQLVLGLAALVTVGLGALGVTRARRWAARQQGKPVWRTAVRMLAVLLPVLALAFYPQGISLISGGRTVTWPSVFYFALPLTLLPIVAAAAGLVVAGCRVRQLAKLRRDGAAA